MYRFGDFTSKANTAINLAIKISGELGHTYVGSEHLLWGLCGEGSGVAYCALQARQVSTGQLRELLVQSIGRGSPVSLTPEDLTPRSRRILERAAEQARKTGCALAGTEHILLSILAERESYALRFLEEIGVNERELLHTVTDALEGEAAQQAVETRPQRNTARAARTPILDKYSRDLTEQAAAGKIDPVIGREAELDRLMRILCRRTKNNPCLIGEAGVGKTAIVEALAHRIAAGKVPDGLRGKRLVSLDLTAMVAGTKYRGDFEDRVKNVLAEVSAAGNVLLFIDEIHNIVGVGAAEGAIDAANILKPPLSRGELQLIGATTLEEYHQHIEVDHALERRFQTVMVEEPDEEYAVRILMGLREKYEAHHKVQIPEESIRAAVRLSARYIGDRLLPDKALDLLDEAASKVNLVAFGAPEQRESMEDQLRRLLEEKKSAVSRQDYERAAVLRDREQGLREEMKQDPAAIDSRPKVTPEDVAEIVSEASGVDVKKLSAEESERLSHLETYLHRSVIGQDDAVHQVAAAVRRGRTGIADPNRPMGSFLFLGPTGVGKTELCRALARELFGTEKALIRLDMSEYMEKHTVSRLVGSPPGYVGYEEGGQLTERVRRRPWCVLLFDEMEKAHPNVYDLLLQVLGDGFLTDSSGRKVNFRNTIVIFTSNLGAREISGSTPVGFSPVDPEDKEQGKEIRRAAMAAARQQLRPEFLGRLDQIVVFDALGRRELRQIAEQQLEILAQRVLPLGCRLRFDASLIEALIQAADCRTYGARPILKAIREKVETPLADACLVGVLPTGNTLCRIENGSTLFEKIG